MAIRQQVLCDGKKMKGYVDYAGIYPEPENKVIAKNALFSMAVGINNSIKTFLGYILTSGLKADLLVAMLKKSIMELTEAGSVVLTITMDGLGSNLSAAEKLGARLNPDSPNFTTSFPHPQSNDPIYVIMDPAHMLKLMRNLFKHYGVLIDNRGRVSTFKLSQINNRSSGKY